MQLSIPIFAAFAAAATAQLSRREYLADFEGLEGAEADVYAARPIGAYDGLYFGSQLALYTVGENNTAAGGVALSSPTQAAMYTLRQTDLSRSIKTRTYDGFTPSYFDLHGFTFGCSLLDDMHQPKKPVGCSVTVKGLASNSQSDIAAQRTFHFRPAGLTQVSMKSVKLGKNFRRLKYLVLDISLNAKVAETVVFIDDIAVTMYGTEFGKE